MMKKSNAALPKVAQKIKKVTGGKRVVRTNPTKLRYPTDKNPQSNIPSIMGMAKKSKTY